MVNKSKKVQSKYKIFIVARYMVNRVHEREFDDKEQAMNFAQFLCFAEWRKHFHTSSYSYKRYNNFHICCLMNQYNAPCAMYLVRDWNEKGVAEIA